MITLAKAREILQLNIHEAAFTMPLDVREALNLAIAAIEAIQDYRSRVDTELDAPLPGEEKQTQEEE
jgi:hypothetical protein